MTGKIGLVFNGVWSKHAVATASKHRDLPRASNRTIFSQYV